MMRLLPALLLPLVFGGCTGLVPIEAAPVMTDEQCRAEARSARDVRIVSREANFENYANMRQTQSDRNAALRAAYESCLRAQGRPVGGGVEPVRRID